MTKIDLTMYPDRLERTVQRVRRAEYHHPNL